MEIVYCAYCQVRVTGQDLENGRAVRSGGRVYCRKCAPAGGELPAPPRPAAPSPGAAAIRPGTARRTPADASARSGRTGLLWGGVAAFAALFIGSLIWVARPVRRPPPSEAPTAANPAPANPSRPIPAGAPVDAQAVQWSRLEAEVKQACDHEEFGRAIEALELAASGSSDRDWTWMIRRSQSEVRARAQSLLENLALQAAAARVRGADTEAASIAARVAAWKLADCRIVLPEKPAAPAPVAPAAQAPGNPPAIGQTLASITPVPRTASSTLPGIPVYDLRLEPGWQDWSFYAQRSFESTDFVQAGHHSIRVGYEANGAGLYLHAPQPMGVDDLEAVEFSCRVEGQIPQLVLKLTDEKNQFWGALPFSQFGGPPPVGEWKRYEYPLAPHHGTGKKVQGLVFQAVFGVSRDPVYFTDIRLRASR